MLPLSLSVRLLTNTYVSILLGNCSHECLNFKLTGLELAYTAGHIDTLTAANPGLIYAGEADYVKFFRQPGYSTKNSQIMSKPT